jgi:hypothetical protein
VKPVYCIGSGDCYRACIATICERSAQDVPNFGEIASDLREMYRLAREWLNAQGFGLFQTYCTAGWPLEKVLSVFSADNPGVPVIVSGVTGINPNETHAVVALNGKVAHDPSGAGLSGPWPCKCEPECDHSWWWIDVVTVADQPRLAA